MLFRTAVFIWTMQTQAQSSKKKKKKKNVEDSGLFQLRMSGSEHRVDKEFFLLKNCGWLWQLTILLNQLCLSVIWLTGNYDMSSIVVNKNKIVWCQIRMEFSEFAFWLKKILTKSWPPQTLKTIIINFAKVVIETCLQILHEKTQLKQTSKL